MTDNSQSTTLPMDVIYDIIGQLATPPNEDAYVHDPGVVAALCSLCPVSRDVHRWSVRRLYDRVSITSVDQLALLLATDIPHRAFIRSLYVGGDDVDLQMEMSRVARLLMIVEPTVERLMCDNTALVIMRHLLDADWKDTGEDFGSMPALREFIFTSSFGTQTFLPDPRRTLSERWPNLQRLAFFANLFDITNQFKGLQVLIFPVSWDMSPKTFRDLVESHPNLHHLVALIPGFMARHSAKFAEFLLTAPQKRAIAETHQGRVCIQEIKMNTVEKEGVNHGARDKWFAKQSRHGTLWALSGQDWLSLE